MATLPPGTAREPGTVCQRYGKAGISSGGQLLGENFAQEFNSYSYKKN